MTELEARIREAAYNRYADRGYEHGHDLEDWLEAEAEIESESNEPGIESGVQQGGTMGPAEDELLKRMIRRHPQKEIPLVEGMEPEKAPSRE
ncbi:MAG TPA: DUF2934 domain-containing protein [Burkholderiales bacterium]|nr:DUF2934 domain-containing protein [Burkholderiales bacterium]